MSDLTNFTYSNIIVRTQVTDDGEPLFCANDVCAILGYANARDAVATHVDTNYDVAKRDIIDSIGRTQSATFVTESGLYALIFGSKLESAKEFKRWVTSEVLPSIRKTGSYSASKTLKEPDLKVKFELAKMMLEPAGIKGNQLTLALDKLYRTNTGKSLLAQTTVQLQAPTNAQLFTPTQLGNQLGIQGAKVNKLLEQLGFQTKVGKLWELTEEGRKQGGTYLDVNKKHSDGTPVRQLKWPMSVLGFIEQLLEVK